MTRLTLKCLLVCLLLATSVVAETVKATDLSAYGRSLINKHRIMTLRLQEMIPAPSPAELKWLDDEFAAADRIGKSGQYEASTNRIRVLAHSHEYLVRGFKPMLSELSNAFEVLASEGRTKIDEAWALSKVISIFSSAYVDANIILTKAVKTGTANQDVVQFMAHADSSENATYGYGTRWAVDSKVLLRFVLEPMLAEMRKGELKEANTSAKH